AAQPDRDGDEHGGRGEARAAARSVDGQGRKIAGHRGEQRDLRLRDGAASRGPLTAEWKVVERERLQFDRVYPPPHPGPVGTRFCVSSVNLSRISWRSR